MRDDILSSDKVRAKSLYASHAILYERILKLISDERSLDFYDKGNRPQLESIAQELIENFMVANAEEIAAMAIDSRLKQVLFTYNALTQQIIRLRETAERNQNIDK